jgi:hypothetical protein
VISFYLLAQGRPKKVEFWVAKSFDNNRVRLYAQFGVAQISK